MKILDKIVVSKNQPKSKNVLWYDSESGEQRAFTSKGWEAISGKSGAVKQTISENFTFTASPGIFYNIENTPDTEVNISFDDNYKVTSKNDAEILISCTAVDTTYSESATMLSMLASLGNGWILTPSLSVDEFSYLYTIQFNADGVEMTLMMYTDKELVKGEKVKVHTPENGIQNEEEFEIIVDDIYYYNNPHIELNIFGQKIVGFVIEEKESDTSNFDYMYTIYCPYLLQIIDVPIVDAYTKKPYYNDNVANVTIQGTTQGIDYEYIVPKEQKPVIEEGKQVGEYIFNIKSPARVILNEKIKWNNGNTPNFELPGIYTISILDGVGCYTYIN